jgi:murein DD-endopeptidase MepM/ murein hydrolase activator NlpD
MDSTGDGLTYQPRIVKLARQAVDLLNRGLPGIAAAAVVAGVALVLAGPVRSLIITARGGEPPASDGPAAGPIGHILAGGLRGNADLPGSAAVSRELVPYTVVSDRPPNRVITYTVLPGDTVTGIAEQFHLDRSTIYWGNLESLGTDVHMLSTGMNLYILPVDGVYHRADGQQTLQWIADHYLVSVESILESEYNSLQGFVPSDIPSWGMRIVVPGGEGPKADWRSPIIEVVDRSGRVVQAFMPNMPGSCGAVSGGSGTGTWVNPVPSGYLITSTFDDFHAGVDLANRIGTPILAADNGVVIFAGWTLDSWGYGAMVVLDHGGWTTYYAHLSRVDVGCGQGVFQGAQVGLMGSTGRSTGPHLHYEMRWNHIPQNPAAYIGF